MNTQAIDVVMERGIALDFEQFLRDCKPGARKAEMKDALRIAIVAVSLELGIAPATIEPAARKALSAARRGAR